jgi:hypothetical protein
LKDAAQPASVDELERLLDELIANVEGKTRIMT